MPLHNYTSLLRGMQLAGYISEEKLECYVAENPLPKFEHPVRKRSTFDCDIISTCMLPRDVGASNVAAYRKGEGNCPYNALSQHLSGDYRYVEELSCWVAYELVIENDIYFDASRECLYYDQPSTELVKNVATLGNFSSVLEVMAAANILGINIVCHHYHEVNPRIRPYLSKKFEPEFRRPIKPEMHIMFTRAGSMRDVRMPYWNPSHFTLVVSRSSVRGRTFWPEQRLKWLELKTHFEEVAAIDQSEIIIDDAEVPDKNLSFDVHRQTSRTSMSNNTQKPVAAKSASRAIRVQKSLPKRAWQRDKKCSWHQRKFAFRSDFTISESSNEQTGVRAKQWLFNSNCPQDVKMK